MTDAEAAFLIPNYLREAVDRYGVDGMETGGCLRAVLENDLLQAVLRADPITSVALPAIVKYCHHTLPSHAWGSSGRVEAWLKEHAERRRRAAEQEVARG